MSDKQPNLESLVAQLSTRLDAQDAQLKTQQQKLEVQEQELARLRTTSFNQPQIATAAKSSRRRLLKQMAAGAAGLAALSVAASPSLALADDPTPPDKGRGKPGGNIDGGNVQLGQPNFATNASPNSANPTRIVNPSGATLDNLVFRVDNYGDNLPTLPANTQISIAGTTSDSGATNAAGKTQIGIYGSSFSGYGASFQGGRAPLFLTPSATTGAPTAGTHNAGEVYVDSAGKLFYCNATGTPGTWGPLSPTVYLDSPTRIVGNPSTAYNSFPTFGPNSVQIFQIEGPQGGTTTVATIPSTATAIIGAISIFNFTLPNQPGFVTVFPANQATAPVVATAAFGAFAGELYTVSFNVKLGTIAGVPSNGKLGIKVYSLVGCQIAIDLVAYQL